MYIQPEIIVIVTAFAVLGMELFLPVRHRSLQAPVTLLGLTTALLTVVYLMILGDGEFLDGHTRAGPKSSPRKWYFSNGSVVFALLCLGPFALPLVWRHPRYKLATKSIITVLVLVAVALYIHLAASVFQQLRSQLDALGIQ